ncbi:hypothetical protein QQF64_012913 [Cirrhinus molitorella]|uniref:Uncharacterized protein n=1 Tax=Cirrhinus molitorella TaxID=172907 RepID=A0ABR3LPM3_9TELE
MRFCELNRTEEREGGPALTGTIWILAGSDMREMCCVCTFTGVNICLSLVNVHSAFSSSNSSSAEDLPSDQNGPEIISIDSTPKSCVLKGLVYLPEKQHLK